MNKNIRLLTWFNFFNDFRPYNPIAIIYFAQVTGSFALGLTIFSIGSISAILFELPTGIFSDMVGRRRTILWGALMSALSLVFFAIGGSFWFLAIGAVLGGVAESLFSGNNNALLYETLDQEGQKEKYADISGKVSSMFQLGLGISALLATIFASLPLSVIMWISVIPQTLCLCIAFFLIEPKIHTEKVTTNIFHHLRDALKKFKENYTLRALSLTSMIDYGIGEVMHQLSPAFLALVWPFWALGIARSLSHAFAFLGFRYAGWIIKKVSVFKSLISGWIGSRLLVIVAVSIPTIISPILISFASFFFGFRMVALDTLMQKEFTDAQRATMGSLNRLGANLLFAIFAFGFGLFADTIGPGRSILIGEIALLLLVGVYWKLSRQVKVGKI